MIYYLPQTHHGHTLLMTLGDSQVVCICQLLPSKSTLGDFRSYPTTSLRDSPSFFTISPSSGQELLLSWASSAEIQHSVLCCLAVSLMPCYSCSFLSWIWCSLDMEFQTDSEHFLDFIFHVNWVTLGLVYWLLVLGVWTHCTVLPLLVTIWPR